jgi:hypothetical protein
MRGFSNPLLLHPLACLDGRRCNDRRVSANGFVTEEEDEERSRIELTELRRALISLVGNEQEYQLLLDIVDKAVSLREVAERTSRDNSVLIRRFSKYLAHLRVLAKSDPDVWSVIVRHLSITTNRHPTSDRGE